MSDSNNLSNETSVDNIIKEILGNNNGLSGGITPSQRPILYNAGILAGGEEFDQLEGGKKRSKTAWIKLVMKNYKKIKRSQGSKNAFKKALKMSKRQYKKRSKK